MARLIILDGPNRGAMLSLIAGQNRIGRDPSLEISIPDKSISRKHAVVTIDPSGPTLADLGSTNATYLNGIRVIGQRPVAHGDEIRLGESIALFVGEDGEIFHPKGPEAASAAAHSETSKIDLAS